MGAVRAGDVIAGKFQVERVLGEGGMGYVVSARHLQLGQTVALKFIRDDVLTSEYKSRFLREARNTVKLKSKHVSRVLDVGTLDTGSPYMVMEYLEGTDLSAMLQQRGAIPASEACNYIIQACEGIAEAHANNIVHRDLKPANLFLARVPGGEPTLKVLDFGVSKVVELATDETNPGGGAFQDSVVTKATDLLGSPSYMAPEQVISARNVDAASDVWSLGVILFRMVAGAPPFAGANLGALVQQIVTGPIPSLRQVRPDVPPGLENVVARCLERERERRPSAVELARLLAPYAGPSAHASLERIAILGPALPPSMPPRPATPHQARWSTPPTLPLPVEPPPKQASSARGTVLWAALAAVVLASLVIVAARGVGSRIAARRAELAASATVSAAPAPTTPPSTTVEPAPAPPPPIEPAPTVSTKPAASARPRAAGHGKPRAPANPNGSQDIPPSRD